MGNIKKNIIGGLATIVLATTIGCTSLPITSQELSNPNNNTYTIQKVKGIKIPFTKDTRIFRGLDLNSYNKSLYCFNSKSFNKDSSYLLEKYKSILADDDTSNTLYVFDPIGKSQDGDKIYESYKVDKTKFDKELEEDSKFYDILTRQGAYVSRNFVPELVDEKDESINSIEIYYTPKVKETNSDDSGDSNGSGDSNYDIPTYIPGNSDTVGGGEYIAGSGGSIGN